MPRVRVLAIRLGSDRAPVPRIAYTAQLFEDGNDQDPVWVCVHNHATPIEAHACGLEHLLGRSLNPQETGAA